MGNVTEAIRRTPTLNVFVLLTAHLGIAASHAQHRETTRFPDVPATARLRRAADENLPTNVGRALLPVAEWTGRSARPTGKNASAARLIAAEQARYARSAPHG